MDYHAMSEESASSSESPSFNSETQSTPPTSAAPKPSEEEQDISQASQSEDTEHTAVSEASPPAVLVTGVRTSASLKKPAGKINCFLEFVLLNSLWLEQ